MNTKHTPGPWIVTDTDYDDTPIVVSKSGEYICSPTGNTVGQEYDNARLIAASPDLLEALLQCDPGPDYPLEDDMPDGGAFCELTVADMRKIRAAITKATAP